MDEMIGYFLALIVGFTLGLLGGGGSILTVPILVYILHIKPTLATSYSLFIVGSTALIGFLRNAKMNLVDYKVGFLFGIPAMLMVYFTRLAIIPNMPDVLYSGRIVITRDMFIMGLFAVLMIMAAVRMIKPDKMESDSKKPIKTSQLIIYGIIVGLLTGLVGAGGGFMIIPALVYMAHLPMKRAVATSLMIISINSLLGFIGSAQSEPYIDYRFLIIFSLCSIVGALIGIQFSTKVDGKTLKKAFGWFVLIMGIYIIGKELLF